MGEYPPLSDEEMRAIKQAALKPESGSVVDGVTLSVEFPAARPGT